MIRTRTLTGKTITWAAAGMALAAIGCGKGSSSSPSSPLSGGEPKTGTVVAHVGDDTITSDEVKARLGEQAPYMLARYETPAAKVEFVNNMIKFEVLAQEAIKKGLDKTPEARQQFKRMLVQELMKNYYDQKIDVSDSDLKDYFAKHMADYNKPEKVRVQHIFIAAEGASRAEAKAKVAKLLAQIKAEEAKETKTASAAPAGSLTPMPLFSQLARDNSTDTVSKTLGGDLRFLSRDELSQRYSPEFATAVFALSADKPVSGVIETPKGFHVARFLGRQAATSQTLDDARFKEQLKERYLAETRSQRFEEYYQQLRKAANVTLDEKAIAEIEVPKKTGGGAGFGGAPSPRPMPPGMGGPMGGPMSGGMPPHLNLPPPGGPRPMPAMGRPPGQP